MTIFHKLACIIFLSTQAMQLQASNIITVDNCWDELSRLHTFMDDETIDFAAFEQTYTRFFIQLSEKSHNDAESAQNLEKLMRSTETLIMMRRTDVLFSFFKNYGSAHTKLRMARFYFNLGHSPNPPAGLERSYWHRLALNLYEHVNELMQNSFNSCHTELTDIFQNHKPLTELKFLHMPVLLRQQCCRTIEWFVIKMKHLDAYNVSIDDYLSQRSQASQNIRRLVINERPSSLVPEQISLIYEDLIFRNDPMSPQSRQRYGWCLHHIALRSDTSKQIYDRWVAWKNFTGENVNISFQEWLTSAPTVNEY